MPIAVRNYPEKADMRRLKANHFNHDSANIAKHINQSKCTLSKPASNDESPEVYNEKMFSSEDEPEDGTTELKHKMAISEFYSSITYGFQLENKYKHEKTNADIMAVAYNSHLRGFVILDTRGIVTCRLTRIGSKVERVLLYPKYQHRVITLLQYVKKYNCYFVLDKDFIVKILNKDFEEVYAMDSETIGASFMVFNSVTDELFTGGVGGTKIWQFHKISAEMFTEIKHLSNYRLTQKTTLPKVGGSWVQKIEVNPTMEHLYCCSEMSVHVYNMTGKLLYYFEQAHTMKITGCCYCKKATVFATSSWDTTVKIWGLNKNLLHTFRGHSKPISNLIVHPNNPLLLVSSSFDGTIKIWSLETLDQIYSLLVYTNDGPMWMFLAEESLIAIFNPRQIKLWSLNHFINFWNLTRCKIFHMSLQTGDSKKSTRVMAVGTDGSLRLFSRKNGKKLCTVLPSPCLSPLEKLLDFCYSRELNLVYFLLNPDTIWIYTSRTDPACRLAKWETGYLQKKEGKISNSINRISARSDFAVECWLGDACQCTAICILTSPIIMTADSNQYCPDCKEFLLLGLQDGRILFMDQIIKGLKYLEFKASKDAIPCDNLYYLVYSDYCSHLECYSHNVLADVTSDLLHVYLGKHGDLYFIHGGGCYHSISHQITTLQHDKLTDSLVSKSKLNDQNLIQIWSLPYLQLQYNIPCVLNLTTWTRLGQTLLTGYADGHLFWHTLTKAEDYGPLNPKMYPELRSDLKRGRVPAHQAEILNVDACPARLSLSSCSSDGTIKIWETSGTLIREIILDDSLGCISFLNDLGDLLVSFKNHIFCIPHSKVYLHSQFDKFEMSASSAEESDIYEDPSIIPEPEEMKSYLVPYQMDFSKYFLQGKLSQMTAEVAEQKKDLDKKEKSIEKRVFLLENIEAAPTEVHLSPREVLSESWSSASFLSHIERVDSLNELNYPAFSSSQDENHLCHSIETNSTNDVKDQMMDSGLLQEDISSVCTKIPELKNLLADSKSNDGQDASHTAVVSVVQSTASTKLLNGLEKENSKEILPDFFAARRCLSDTKTGAFHLMPPTNPQLFKQINRELTTKQTRQGFDTSQKKLKKPPVTIKKSRKKKKCTTTHKKCANKQDRTPKNHHGDVHHKEFILKESNVKMANQQRSEECTSQKYSASANHTSKEEYVLHADDKQPVTRLVNSLQTSNENGKEKNRPQKTEKEEIEINPDVNNENHHQPNIENQILHQTNVKDHMTEIPECKPLTKTNEKNPSTSAQKKLDINSKKEKDNTVNHSGDERNSSPECKYLPMTVKIIPRQPEHEMNTANKNECIPLSKPHSVYNSRTEYSQNQQTELHIRLDEVPTKFSRAKTSTLHHSQDENHFGKDWYKRQIERHHLQQIQKNLRLKSAEHQRQMLAENKINPESDYNKKSHQIIAEDGRIIPIPGSNFSSFNKMNANPDFPKFKRPLCSTDTKTLHMNRCKSAPVSTDQSKTSNKTYSHAAYSSTLCKTSTHPSDKHKCQISTTPEDTISKVKENKIEKQEFSTNYRLSLPTSQAESPRSKTCSSSRVPNNARKYQMNNTYLTHTKSIPDKSGPCQMIVIGDSMVPNYRFPTPLEVRLLTKRFPRMSARILYHHYTQPHRPNRRIGSAPSGRYFFTHNP